MPTILIFLLCFSIAYLATPALRRLALRLAVLDRPNHRKTHQQATPLLGGLAIYLSLILSLLLNLPSLRLFSSILIGATIILIIGLIDDLRDLSAQIRLIGQLLAAGVVIGSGIRLTFLPKGLWGDAGEILLTLIWIVGITNALNYLDGIDGLAAGLTAISAFFFAVISFQTGQFEISLAAALLLAACLGFLPHNFRQAKVFLGDAGSTLMGFVLAGIAVQGDWAEDNVVKLAVPILILAIPIFDMAFTTIMRIKEKKVHTLGEWLKYGGKDHFHHRLIDLGLFPREATFFIYFVCISFGINAMMVSNEKAVIGVLAILQASIIFVGIAVLMLTGKRRHE